jgi:anti-sigma B factor antagonist
MSFDIDHHDGIEVVHLNVARLDINTSRQFKALMDDQSIKPGDRVILDFDGVEFLDSTGLGMLVQLMKYLAAPKQMVLCHVKAKAIVDILYMTRMNQAFNIQDSLEQAKAVLNNQ